MKLSLLTFFAALLSFASYSQQYDSRLLDVYSESELAEISNEHPDRIKVLNYAIDHAVQVMDLPKGKDATFDGSLNADLKNPKWTDLKIKLKETNQYYRITGTDKVIMVKSFYVLGLEMNSGK